MAENDHCGDRSFHWAGQGAGKLQEVSGDAVGETSCLAAGKPQIEFMRGEVITAIHFMFDRLNMGLRQPAKSVNLIGLASISRIVSSTRGSI
jgi:hypothetical protein